MGNHIVQAYNYFTYIKNRDRPPLKFMVEHDLTRFRTFHSRILFTQGGISLVQMKILAVLLHPLIPLQDFGHCGFVFEHPHAVLLLGYELRGFNIAVEAGLVRLAI